MFRGAQVDQGHRAQAFAQVARADQVPLIGKASYRHFRFADQFRIGFEQSCSLTRRDSSSAGAGLVGVMASKGLPRVVPSPLEISLPWIATIAIANKATAAAPLPAALICPPTAVLPPAAEPDEFRDTWE
jgi:hypothetical protein